MTCVTRWLLLGLFAAAGCRGDVETPPAAGAISGDAVVPATGDADAARHKARSLIATGRAESDEFRNAVRSIAATFPVVRPAASDARADWQSVTIDAGGIGFDAVRFTSPLDSPADLHWAFALPADAPFDGWFILPAEGAMGHGFTDYRYEEDVALDVAGAPMDNVVIFQRLEGGEILPGKEYVIWFSLSQPGPTRVDLAMRLSQAGSRGPAETSQAVAEVLDLRTPLRTGAPVAANPSEGPVVLGKSLGQWFRESDTVGETRTAAHSAAGCLTEGDVPGLIEGLATGEADDPVAGGATFLLTSVSTPDAVKRTAVPGLIELLSHDGAGARANAAYVLGDYAEYGLADLVAPARSRLTELLSDPHEDVRGCAEYALGELGDAG